MKGLEERVKENLTYSETSAAKLVIERMKGKQKEVIVASELADKYGISRSTLNNTLCKLELAGLIEKRGLGMKGTMVELTNKDAEEIIRSI